MANVPLFSRLDAVHIGAIVELLKPKVVPPRYVIVRHGEAADAMYFIVEGEVEVDLAPAPKRLGQGDWFGEIALLKHIRRTATVSAVIETRLLVLDAADFSRMVEASPALAETLRATMNARLAEIEASGMQA